MSRLPCITLLLGVALVPARTAQAQAAPAQPEVHVLTVSSFQVPLGEDRGKVMQYIEKWMVPPARTNPNVISYRVGQHWYGANSSDIVIIAEYPNWSAVTAPCDPCQQWTRNNQPKEGTAERKAFDESLALFLKYYSSHADQIFTVPMSMAKP